MTWWLCCAVPLLLCALAVPASAQSAPPLSPGAACSQAAAAAEHERGLPSGVLLAIGRVESGRRDAATGQVLPWPWAVNAAGQSRLFSTGTEAASFVTAQLAQGVRSIDVGCFQINLAYHPTAFATLAEAFDPAANARYAAQFLSALHAETNSWPDAVGRYHSATPALAAPYRTAVLGAWSGNPAGAPAGALVAPAREIIAGVIVNRPGVTGAYWAPAGPDSHLPRVIHPSPG